MRTAVRFNKKLDNVAGQELTFPRHIGAIPNRALLPNRS